jgi:hypothetical protein
VNLKNKDAMARFAYRARGDAADGIDLILKGCQRTIA